MVFRKVARWYWKAIQDCAFDVVVDSTNCSSDWMGCGPPARPLTLISLGNVDVAKERRIVPSTKCSVGIPLLILLLTASSFSSSCCCSMLIKHACKFDNNSILTCLKLLGRLVMETRPLLWLVNASSSRRVVVAETAVSVAEKEVVESTALSRELKEIL